MIGGLSSLRVLEKQKKKPTSKTTPKVEWRESMVFFLERVGEFASCFEVLGLSHVEREVVRPI